VKGSQKGVCMEVNKNSDGSIVVIPQTAHDHIFLKYFSEMIAARDKSLINVQELAPASEFQSRVQGSQP